MNQSPSPDWVSASEGKRPVGWGRFQQHRWLMVDSLWRKGPKIPTSLFHQVKGRVPVCSGAESNVPPLTNSPCRFSPSGGVAPAEDLPRLRPGGEKAPQPPGAEARGPTLLPRRHPGRDDRPSRLRPPGSRPPRISPPRFGPPFQHSKYQPIFRPPRLRPSSPP